MVKVLSAFDLFYFFVIYVIRSLLVFVIPWIEVDLLHARLGLFRLRKFTVHVQLHSLHLLLEFWERVSSSFLVSELLKQLLDLSSVHLHRGLFKLSGGSWACLTSCLRLRLKPWGCLDVGLSLSLLPRQNFQLTSADGLSNLSFVKWTIICLLVVNRS